MKLFARALCVGVLFASLAGVAAPLKDLRQSYAALKEGRYEEVEALYAAIRRENSRTPGGEYAWEEFNWLVYWNSSSDPAKADYWPKVDAGTKAWVEHSPRSYVAAMTRAFALAYRSGSVQAREGNWKEADMLATEARRLMDASKASGASDPLWHAVRLRVASAEGVPRTDLLDLIHAAVAVDPTVMRVWQEAALALGHEGEGTDELAWLMRLALQRGGSREGVSIYARVFQASYWHFRDLQQASMGRRGLDWPQLDESFTDWKKRYPASYPIDLHAALACSARDRKATAKLLPQIGAQREDVWKLLGGKNYFSACKEWLKAEPPRSTV